MRVWLYYLVRDRRRYGSILWLGFGVAKFPYGSGELFTGRRGLYNQKSTETCDRIARSLKGTAWDRPGAKDFFLAGSFAPGLFLAPGASIRLQSTLEHA